MYFFKKRKQKRWIWIAYHRRTRQILDFQIGGRGFAAAAKFFDRLEENYIIDGFATHNYQAYHQIIKKERHITGKQFTQGIESLNSKIGYYLAGFARKTKDYFKSEQTMESALKLLFWHHS